MITQSTKQKFGNLPVNKVAKQVDFREEAESIKPSWIELAQVPFAAACPGYFPPYLVDSAAKQNGFFGLVAARL